MILLTPEKFISAFSQGIGYLFGVIVDIFEYFFDNPLLYIPAALFLVVGFIYVIVSIIQDVSGTAEGGSTYNPWQYRSNQINANHFYTPKYKFPLTLAKAHWARKQAKELQLMSEQELFAEQQEYLKAKSIADEFFKNNPDKMKVSFNGLTFFNGDDWYKKHWGKDGKLRHTTVYAQNDDGTFSPIKDSFVSSSFESPFSVRTKEKHKPSYDLEKAKHDARYKPIKYVKKNKE